MRGGGGSKELVRGPRRSPPRHEGGGRVRGREGRHGEGRGCWDPPEAGLTEGAQGDNKDPVKGDGGGDVRSDCVGPCEGSCGERAPGPSWPWPQ